MKILLSAFACRPNTGSEAGGGWRWALELAKHNDVYVLTDISSRISGDNCVPERPRLHFISYRPRILRKVILSSVVAQLVYSAWQYGLFFVARKLHKEIKFDLAIHLTYGVFRHPCFLGFLGIPFVFGPVGGGEDAPLRLKKSFPTRDLAGEAVRYLLNLAARFNPFLWLALSRANLILVRTRETGLALPWPFRRRAIEHQEIGATIHKRQAPIIERTGTDPFRVMFAGRLLAWKGIHLALRAVAITRTRGLDVEFLVVGSGPKGSWLRELAKSLNLGRSSVKWVDHVPQEALFKMYEDAHCLLFPSLHDSGGNVVLEALGSGLPVVCLDIGGPRTLVSRNCAIVVNTIQKSEDEVVAALADALVKLATDENQRTAMAKAAILRAQDFAWERRVIEVMSLISDHCGCQVRSIN
jgi:glycosyltransferase involved in cell wall biosynthesis